MEKRKQKHADTTCAVGPDPVHAPYPKSINKKRNIRFLRLLIALFVATLFVLRPFPFPFSSPDPPTRQVPLTTKTTADPASEWQDNVWPLRPPTPWDISTDFPYKRLLEYDVTEGTWLRLDVHPVSGDIVFDMAGDLWCLPGTAYSHGEIGEEDYTKAHPILMGVPHDSDPHFSPKGDRLVWRSDAELGVENVWVMRWRGCEKMDVRPQAGEGDKQLVEALNEQNYEETLLANGVKETKERKQRRLLREGRSGAQRVTNETYRWVSDARFHPSGTKVIATKWYTSGRSLGAGEGWEYSVPSVRDLEASNVADSPVAQVKQDKIEAGSGKRVLGRTLPPGWEAEQYGDQQIGPEQFIWRGEDSVIYSKNVRDASTFSYSKDVHSGIYAIFSRNLTTNETETLVDAFPGGASRPELSRDGRTLAFVRRVRDKEALVLKDLHTGTIHHAWHGLTYDLSAVSAPMGTYPSFAFTPSNDGIIIWAAGQIYHVPLFVNAQGEKVSLPRAAPPKPIRFRAHIEKRVAETLRGGVDVVGIETQEKMKVGAFKELVVDEEGRRAVFQGAGVNYVQDVGQKDVQKVPVLHANAPYYSPSFVPRTDGGLVLHARWSDANFSSFELADLNNGVAHEVVGLPLGRYFSPVLCECYGSHRQIAFVKTGGDLLTGDIVATAEAGLYIGFIDLPPSDATTPQKITVQNLRFIRSEIDTDDVIKMRFVEKNVKLLVQQSARAFVIDIGVDPNEAGVFPHYTVAEGEMSSEIVVAPKEGDMGGCGFVADGVAFVDFFHVYVVDGEKVGEGEKVWSKPANATKGLVRVSLDGGHDVVWSRDRKKLFWFLGPFLHSLEVAKLSRCSSAIRDDHSTFGISCVKKLLEYQEVIVEHPTDIARLKQDARASTHKPWIHHQETDNADVVVIFNATLLTMETGDPWTDLIHDGMLVSRGGIIDSVGALENMLVPNGATVIDAMGGFIVPGFIDVHAHWDGFETRYPAKSWELETFLAYGVTTLHNPSADNVDGFVERSRVERGQLIGPRIFTVGDIIYGAGEPGIHQDIVDMAEAYSALRRIKAEGGRSSISYKNYNLPSRASRQRLLMAARDLNMLCVPEGGMNYDWDLTYIIDGMTTVEHALPVSTLYDDVLNLFALSGTGSTPTHIVNYGGAWGEQFVWAHVDVPNDPKLRRFTRHDILEGLSESTARPSNSYSLFNTSESVAKLVERGLRTHIGAHGEPPLGLNYHAEMFFAKQGGLSNYEVIRAATKSAAITLGMDGSLGSLSQGKLADFLVYPPGVNLLEGDILKTKELRLVARGGRIWEASTMEEIWPRQGKKQQMPPLNPE